MLDTQSAFGITIKTLKENVDTLTTQMTTLLADAPETLDTLNEIAAAISDDPAFFSSMASANTTLQNNIDALSTAAATARTALQTALQANIDAEALTGANGRAALSTRLDSLELDPVTKTYVDTAVSNLLDAAPTALDTLNELAAALGDDANFATTITNSIAAVQADVDQNEADADTAIAAVATDLTTEIGARGTADTALNNLIDSNKSLADAAIAAVQADVDQNEADADAAIALKFDKAGGTITGNLAVAKNWPDVELKSGDEKRILFADAGGHATAALKHVSGSLDFYVGGIGGSNKEMSLDTDGLDVSALKIDGTAVTATAAEINAFDNRLDTLEADPTTAAAVAAVQADVDANEAASDAAETALSNRLDTLEADPTTAAAVAAVQADVDQNETDSDAADTALSNRLDVLEADPTTAAAVAAVQADVDQNESDADAAIALKADAADSVLTGTTEAKGILNVGNDGLNSGYYLKIQRNGNTQLDLLARNIPSGGNLNITNSNANNARVVVYSDEFWVRNLGGTSGNGKAKFDGDVTFGDGLIVSGGLTDAADDSAAATAGVAVGQLYRNGSVVMIRVS